MYTDKKAVDAPEAPEAPITHPEDLPRVFFDVEHGGKPMGRIVMELFRLVPREQQC